MAVGGEGRPGDLGMFDSVQGRLADPYGQGAIPQLAGQGSLQPFLAHKTEEEKKKFSIVSKGYSSAFGPYNSHILQVRITEKSPS